MGEHPLAMAVVDVAEIHALGDRRVPGTRAHIYLFVIGPAGIFVIDAKRYGARSTSVVSTVSSPGRLLRAAHLLGPLVDYRGKPVVRCESDASLFAFEKTSTLVPTGIR